MNKLPGLFALTTLAVAQVTSISPGTSITVRTNEAIYARQSDGRVFTGIVEQDVPDVNGNVAIARGSQVELTARNVSGNELVLDLESVTTNGQRFAVTAEADRVGSSRGQVSAQTVAPASMLAAALYLELLSGRLKAEEEEQRLERRRGPQPELGRKC